jgi:hypothetical protein
LSPNWLLCYFPHFCAWQSSNTTIATKYYLSLAP